MNEQYWDGKYLEIIKSCEVADISEEQQLRAIAILKQIYLDGCKAQAEDDKVVINSLIPIGLCRNQKLTEREIALLDVGDALFAAKIKEV